MKAEVTSGLCLVFMFTRILFSLEKAGSVSLLNLRAYATNPRGLSWPHALSCFLILFHVSHSHSLHSQGHPYFLVCFLPSLLDSTSLAHSCFPFVSIGSQCTSDVQHTFVEWTNVFHPNKLCILLKLALSCLTSGSTQPNPDFSTDPTNLIIK